MSSLSPRERGTEGEGGILQAMHLSYSYVKINIYAVMPVKTGIQKNYAVVLDSGLCRNDGAGNK